METVFIVSSIIAVLFVLSASLVELGNQFSGFETAGGKPDFYFKSVTPNFYENKTDMTVCVLGKSAKELGLKELPVTIKIADPKNPDNTRVINAQPPKDGKNIVLLESLRGGCLKYTYTLSADDMSFYDSVKPEKIRFILDNENLVKENNEDNNDAVFDCAGRLCIPKVDEFRSVTQANPAKYGKYMIYRLY